MNRNSHIVDKEINNLSEVIHDQDIAREERVDIDPLEENNNTVFSRMLV